MKKFIDNLDALPSKRIFFSIIADYDVNKSICELIDNGLDVWTRNGKNKLVEINIGLDESQQKILVSDNAGGLPSQELSYIVGPGQTGSSTSDETIGIFGVGTKRAVVALAEDIKIKTRFQKESTFQVDIDNAWIEDEDEWTLPYYEINNIEEGTTIIELQSLRGITINPEVIAQVKAHLSITYAKFLHDKRVIIKVNKEKLTGTTFENWAFPKEYGPRRYRGPIRVEGLGEINVEAIAGLTQESSPASGEYGVYFYCNDRLVARALKTLEMGFTKGLAGSPHPKVSLTRVLIYLHGNAQAMPWNSSKSNINTNHPVFIALQNWLISVVKDYASLSRIWQGDWPENVFQYKEGDVEEVEIANFSAVKKSYLPPLPKSKPRYADKVAALNKNLVKKKPWCKGLYEGVIAADYIIHQRWEQKNRIALIVLDSTLEIAFKDYLVNESGKSYSDKTLLDLFKDRTQVHAEIKKFVNFTPTIWRKIVYYYNARSKLIHEKITVSISDSSIQDFKDVVQSVLKKLYRLSFG